MGLDVPQRLRPDPAPRGAPPRIPLGFQHLRRGRLPAPHRLLRERPRPRPQALSTQRNSSGNQQRQERADRLRELRRPGQRRLSREGGRRLPPVPAATPGGVGHGLRRPADGDGRAANRFPRGPRALPGPLPLHHGRRVPGHEPRPVRPGLQAGCQAPQPVRRRRFRPEHLRVPGRRHPQHPGVRAGLSRRLGRPPGTELPVDRGHPRSGQCGDRQQRSSQAEAAVDGSGSGRGRRGVRGPGRAR